MILVAIILLAQPIVVSLIFGQETQDAGVLVIEWLLLLVL